MDITRLIVRQFDGLRERSECLIKHFQIGIGDAQMVIDVGNVSLKWLVLQCRVQVFNGFLELLVLVVSEASLVKDTRVVLFSA